MDELLKNQGFDADMPSEFIPPQRLISNGMENSQIKLKSISLNPNFDE